MLGLQAPLTDFVEYAILGAGYGGLCAGARLREAGVAAADIRLVDKAGDVGGTWYWNRYPGAMCDVESYVRPFPPRFRLHLISHDPQYQTTPPFCQTPPKASRNPATTLECLYACRC